MNKTLEQLIVEAEFPTMSLTDFKSIKHMFFPGFYTFEKIVELLKQVREATIKECIEKVNFTATYPIGNDINIFMNKEELLNLDLNSIEL